MKSFEIQTKIHRRGWFSSTLNLKKPLISAHYNHILSWHGGCLSGFINGVNISIPEDAPHDPRRDYMNPFYNPTKTVSPNPSTTACSFAGATGALATLPLRIQAFLVMTSRTLRALMYFPLKRSSTTTTPKSGSYAWGSGESEESRLRRRGKTRK
jgi:hypothetical protein